MILIIILIVLLVTWFVLYMKKLIKKEKEGLDNPSSSSTDAALPTLQQYQPPPSTVTNDPMYMATLNASNISYLKEKVDNVLNLKQQVMDISGQVATITTTVNNLSTQLSSNVSSSTGGCDPNNPSACPVNNIAANAVSGTTS
jgi:hypothetical protein